jgi:arylsulfatase A-like enzyme
LYDGEIAYADFAIGRFLDELDALGLYDSSLIVVFGDHGEGFLEHGLMNHGNSVYDELIRVPLLMRFPGGGSAGTSIEEPVQLIDVTPTILNEVGIRPLTGMQGSPLLDAASTNGSRRFAYASEGFAACLRTSSWKLIENPPSRSEKIPRAKRVRYELYDLGEDPKELNNLAATMLDRVESMARTLGVIDEENRSLRSRIRDALDVKQVELTEEQERELRSLGYIQ